MKRLWLKYVLLLVPFWLAGLASLVCAPIAVLWFSTDDRRSLRRPFVWMMTGDNDLGGDDGWRNEHIAPGSDPYSTWNRTRWMWRNGGNNLNYDTFGCAVADPHPMLRKFVSLGRGYFLELFFGWNMPGPINGRCKYACNIRIRTTTN